MRGQTKEVEELPTCDHCDKEATHESNTIDGKTENLCYHHFLLMGKEPNKKLILVKDMQISSTTGDPKKTREIAKTVMGLKKTEKTLFGKSAFRRWKRSGALKSEDGIMTVELKGKKWQVIFKGKKVELIKIKGEN